MANNGNHLYMNFENSNDRFTTSDRSAFPTTPSTFPQPVFAGLPSQTKMQNGPAGGVNGGLPVSGQQQTQSQQYLGAGYGSSNGYFNQGQYPSNYAAQPAANAAEYAQGNGTIGQATSLYAPPRSNTPGTASNDPNTGLAHQFSHQNLGGSARGNAYNGRGPSPSRRPRTAGASGQQAGYGYLNAPLPPQPPVADFETAPERSELGDGRYGVVAESNKKKCFQLSADFFKDSVKRARERNQR
jgi:protein-serine/threonine kinase